MKKNSYLTGRMWMLLILLVVSLTAMTACGEEEPKNLEEYVNQDQEEKQAIQDMAGDSNIQIGIKGNEITMSYQLEEELAPYLTQEQIDATFEKYLSDMEGKMVETIQSLETDTGFSGILITVVYSDSSKAEVYRGTFDKSGMTKSEAVTESDSQS